MLKITKDSHTDHVSEEILVYIKERFANRNEFFIETFELPLELPPVQCGLYGPLVGDDPVREELVQYKIRESRCCASRVLIDGRTRPTKTLTVIAGPHEGESCVLYTAYGGPVAPREPGDPAILNGAEWERSRDFWREHALAV